jgi:tRNA(Ile)-lysidine synthase
LAARTTARLGVAFRALDWTGEKPSRGLPAAARKARHGLIAEAARAAGARVVVFGHTADDELEAGLMRAAGSNLGHLAEWRPSPVWPEGRGLFVLRPLLGLRRSEIRERLAPLGFDWIEDPANDDPRWLRARARARLPGGDEIDPALIQTPSPELAELARAAQVDAVGVVRLERSRLLGTPQEVARRFLSAALVCVSGGVRPPRRAALEALLARLAGEGAVVATLAGARLSAQSEILIVRESGSYRRHGEPQVRLEPGQAVVWDGRFLLSAPAGAGGLVIPLDDRAPKQDTKQAGGLSPWSREVRAALPALLECDGRITCPILAGDHPVATKSLVAERLNGACGVFSREPTR